MVVLGPRIEMARQEAGVSPQELLNAYRELGGVATPAELGAFLVGEIDLEQLEMEKLRQALTTRSRPDDLAS